MKRKAGRSGWAGVGDINLQGDFFPGFRAGDFHFLRQSLSVQSSSEGDGFLHGEPVSLRQFMATRLVDLANDEEFGRARSRRLFLRHFNLVAVAQPEVVGARVFFDIVSPFVDLAGAGILPLHLHAAPVG